MFAATVINFLLSSLDIGDEVAGFIVLTRKALILDIDYPLLAKPELVNNALRNENIVNAWSENLPVSGNLSLAAGIPYLFMFGGGIAQ